MTSDRDIERELAELLDRTAKPLPDHVLHESVRAALRSDQVRARGRFGRVTVLRQATGLVLAVVVVLAVASAPSVIGWLGNLDLRLPVGSGASPTPVPGTPAAAMSWDAMLQFRELNPAPDGYGHRFVFSWLRSSGPEHDPATYVPLPEFEETEDGTQRWFDPEFDGPGIGQLYIGSPPGEDHLHLHPWGGGADARAPIIAWRNPEDASLVLSGTVEVDGTCGDGVAFSIEHGPDVFQAMTVRSGRQTFEIPVDIFHAGEVLHFIFEPGANSDCDTTRFNVQIRTR